MHHSKMEKRVARTTALLGLASKRYECLGCPGATYMLLSVVVSNAVGHGLQRQKRCNATEVLRVTQELCHEGTVFLVEEP